MTEPRLPPFATLNVDLVIDAVESLGYLSDLRILPLNSYENRVYQVGIEEQDPIIAKFYRPQRWSKQQILEEHQFSLSLSEMEIPVIPPIIAANGETLHEYEGFWFSLFPRRGGHAPELYDLDVLYTLGQHIGRIHAMGQIEAFKYRPTIDLQTFAIEPREFILANQFIPSSLEASYQAITHHLITRLKIIFEQHRYTSIRLHGDCHPGNIMTRPDSMYIVDLDDCRNGPAIQDLWMLLSGDRSDKVLQMSSILEGYEEFNAFDKKELHLIEALRTLRLIHYAGWLAKRWHDPAFPMAFPWFNTERYWAEHILELKEQLSELDEESIKLSP